MLATSRRSFLALGAGLLAGVAYGAPAVAQMDEDDEAVIEHRRRPRRRRRRRYEEDLGMEPEGEVEEQQCQKMCETDMSPCDPIQMKITDGRCSSPVAGPTF